MSDRDRMVREALAGGGWSTTREVVGRMEWSPAVQGPSRDALATYHLRRLERHGVAERAKDGSGRNLWRLRQ